MLATLVEALKRLTDQYVRGDAVEGLEQRWRYDVLAPVAFTDAWEAIRYVSTRNNY